MDIKPIRTAVEHREAVREIERLWNSPAGSREHDRLDVLATLVDVWEAAHQPIDPPDPVEAILFRMDQMGLTRQDLEPLIGSRARVSEILGRRRSLTLPMMRRLHATLGIPADVLLAG